MPLPRPLRTRLVKAVAIGLALYVAMLAIKAVLGFLVSALVGGLVILTCAGLFWSMRRRNASTQFDVLRRLR